MYDHFAVEFDNGHINCYLTAPSEKGKWWKDVDFVSAFCTYSTPKVKRVIELPPLSEEVVYHLASSFYIQRYCTGAFDYPINKKWFEEASKHVFSAIEQEEEDILTFNEFIQKLGYKDAQEVDYSGAIHEVVGLWLDYVNSNKQ